jgi:3-methyladenine DNA glycosylase AlkD
MGCEAEAIQVDVDMVAAEIVDDIRALPRLNTAEIRTVRRRYSKRLIKASSDDVIELAHRLIALDHRWVGYELVYYHRAARVSLGPAQVEVLGQGIDSWSSVDGFGCLISGPAWRENQVPDTLIHRWARAEDRWWRRAALVSTVPLNVRARGGTGDVPRTLRVCRMLIDDRDDMVVKALSWALRVLVVHDAEAVSAFLAEYEDRLAARVKREVRNKLTTGLKNPRRKQL